MTRKIQSLKRLRWLRDKQKKTAAAHRGDAERSLGEAVAGLEGARARYARASQAVGAKLGEIRSVSEIELLRGDLADFRQSILASQHIAAQAKLQLEVRAAEVGRRHRALECSEKLLCQAVTDDASTRDKREQRESDDRAASRRKKTA